MLVAAALRLSQGMGLHLQQHPPIIPTDPSLDPSLVEEAQQQHAEHEQRRRVFWLAYFLDKDISLRTGQPYTQDDNDLDAACLPLGPLAPLPGCPGAVNFFSARIGLAVLQGQVYSRLYSPQARWQSAEQVAAAAGELNALLGFWRDSIPGLYFEDDPRWALRGGGLGNPVGLPVEHLHMLLMRFTYVHCLAMIDRCISPQTQTADPLEGVVDAAGNILMPDFGVPEESICVIESRKAVGLIQITPPGDFAYVW